MRSFYQVEGSASSRLPKSSLIKKRMLRPRFLEDFLKRLGFIRPETFAEVDPDLVPLIANIAAKEGLTPAETVNQLLSFAVGEHHFTDENLALWHTLTDREKETAAFTCLGYTNQEIARKMFISPNTVKTHLRRVLHKFQVNSKAELQLTLASWDFRAWDKDGRSVNGNR